MFAFIVVDVHIAHLIIGIEYLKVAVNPIHGRSAKTSMFSKLSNILFLQLTVIQIFINLTTINANIAFKSCIWQLAAIEYVRKTNKPNNQRCQACRVTVSERGREIL